MNPGFEQGETGWTTINPSEYGITESVDGGSIVSSGGAFDGSKYWISGSSTTTYYGLEQELTICADAAVGSVLSVGLEYIMSSDCSLYFGLGSVGGSVSTASTSWTAASVSGTMNAENIGNQFNLYFLGQCSSGTGTIQVDHITLSYTPAPGSGPDKP